MKSLKYAVCLTCSVVLNLLLLNMYLHSGSEKSWTRNAVEEAEAVASISCSGHGRAFLDGVLVHGKPICECNACYGGPDCSQLLPDCMVDADSGDPTFLEPFWLKNTASSSIVVAGWHRMSYEFSDGSLISEELKAQIRTVHAKVGNAKTDGKYIIFGAGATQLLHAAVHALSTHGSTSTTKVVASTPYYPVYKEQTEFFKSEDYKFKGDSSTWKKDAEDSRFIELVTSPNNPDGELRKAVLQGTNVKTIHDLAYYWPHFTPISSPADEDLMIFTLSKLTGHAGSRFGWAIVKDEAVYRRMLTYMDLSTYGVSRETQLRVLKLLKVVLNGDGKGMYEFGYNAMRSRWSRLSKSLSQSKRFSIQQLKPQYCAFSKQIRSPSPAFAWLKCEEEEVKSCYEVLKEFNITGRAGSLFGAESRYVRLSLVKSDDDFDLLLRQINKLVSEEEIDDIKLLASTSADSGKSNGSMLAWHIQDCEKRFKEHSRVCLGVGDKNKQEKERKWNEGIRGDLCLHLNINQSEEMEENDLFQNPQFGEIGKEWIHEGFWGFNPIFFFIIFFLLLLKIEQTSLIIPSKKMVEIFLYCFILFLTCSHVSLVRFRVEP